MNTTSAELERLSECWALVRSLHMLLSHHPLGADDYAKYQRCRRALVREMMGRLANVMHALEESLDA